MYLNIIDSRRRDTQKKMGRYIQDLIDGKEELGVREVVKKYNVWNKTLEDYFGLSFKLVSNKKVYILDEEYVKLFKHIKKCIDKTELHKEDPKIKRLFFAYLYYNLSKK